MFIKVILFLVAMGVTLAVTKYVVVPMVIGAPLFYQFMTKKFKNLQKSSRQDVVDALEEREIYNNWDNADRIRMLKDSNFNTTYTVKRKTTKKTQNPK